MRGWDILSVLVHGCFLWRVSLLLLACFLWGEGFILKGKVSLFPCAEASLLQPRGITVIRRCRRAVLRGTPVVHPGWYTGRLPTWLYTTWVYRVVYRHIHHLGIQGGIYPPCLIPGYTGRYMPTLPPYCRVYSGVYASLPTNSETGVEEGPASPTNQQ